eukprot:scaffold66689_cov43-Phaeocystis_antarctica.AAC.1
MKGHAEEELKRSSGRAVCGGNRCYVPTPCARRVLCRLRDGAMRGYAGGRRTATSAKVPLGSIATPFGYWNRALPPAPLVKPAEPLPASVVVAPLRGGDCDGSGDGGGDGGGDG